MKLTTLPKLYVLGDSISIHYGSYLKSYLKGIMEYSRKEAKEETSLHLEKPQGDSGGDSSMVLSFLKAKMLYSGIDADYLLLNCGLHDIKTDPTSGRKQVPLLQYERNLREIMKIIRNNKLHLIWVRTTLFEDSIHNRSGVGFYRYAADCIEYNLIADHIMAEYRIPSIDLCAFTLNLGGRLFCDHVHFTEVVRKKQAAYIAEKLIERLGNPDQRLSTNIFLSSMR